MHIVKKKKNSLVLLFFLLVHNIYIYIDNDNRKEKKIEAYKIKPSYRF